MALKYTVEEAVAAWRLSSRIASYTSGRLTVNNDHIKVTATVDQKNLAREESAKIQHSYFVLKQGMQVVSGLPAADISLE